MQAKRNSVALTPILQGRPHIRTSWDVVHHLPTLYRQIAIELIRLGDIQIVDEEPPEGLA